MEAGGQLVRTRFPAAWSVVQSSAPS
jgi:hypothetical protein